MKTIQDKLFVVGLLVVLLWLAIDFVGMLQDDTYDGGRNDCGQDIYGTVDC